MTSSRSAFTLVEISIVLVIVGLLIGGTVVGKDLIAASVVRAQITQIEQYQAAVATFTTKYGGLPGDLAPALASKFGFWPRGGGVGTGDGNGVIQGAGCGGGWGGTCVGGGEPLMFWSDLSYANGMNINLIDQVFKGANSDDNFMLGLDWYYPIGTQDGLAQMMPRAKFSGDYVYVWSGGFGSNYGTPDSTNYYEVTQVNFFNGGAWGSPGVSVAQAYAIDKKIDDGMPMTGTVLAISVDGGWVSWSAAQYNGGNWTYPGADDPTTCFNFTSVAYSISINGGAGINCDLAFAFAQ